MPRIERDREIARRRQRKVKIQKLIEKYMKSTVQADKAVIATKVPSVEPVLQSRRTCCLPEG